MSFRLPAAALGVCLLLLSGCGAAEGGEDAAASDQPRPGQLPRLVTYQPSGIHHTAKFTDVLSVNEAGCFALSDGSTIMLPSTWTVSPDGGGVISGGAETRIGEHFEAGGGMGGPPRKDLTAAQRACPSDGPPFSNGGKYKSFAALSGL
jgi:hypothetical protein